MRHLFELVNKPIVSNTWAQQAYTANHTHAQPQSSMTSSELPQHYRNTTQEQLVHLMMPIVDLQLDLPEVLSFVKLLCHIKFVTCAL